MYETIIENWRKANPIGCHFLGIHDYDGDLPDFSDEFIRRRVDQLKSELSKLEQIGEPEQKFEKFNWYLVKSALEQELFQLDIQQEYKKSPIPYIYPMALIEMSFTVRNFTSVKERVKTIIKLQKGIPDFLEQAQQNLEPSLAQVKIGMGTLFLPGIISYWNDKLIEFVTQVDEESLIEEWSQVNLKAVEAVNRFLEALKTKFMPNAHTDFALGEEKFLERLEKEEGIKISLEKLLEVGEKDLERNYQALLEIGKTVPDLHEYLNEIQLDFPKADNLLQETKESVVRAKQFLIDSEIVGIPTDVDCKVIPTPDFFRVLALAAMNTPGTFEVPEAKEAYYYVSLPDPNWPKEKADTYMQFFNRPSLEIVTVHEVWPGHYLQLLFNNKSTNEIAKYFAYSTTMIEGWGHYTEEMVYDEGYEPFDRKRLHVGQLLLALHRNCRYISAVKMHCHGMTVEESKQLFMEKSFLPEPAAQIEANRGTYDPMYLCYNLGKLLIFKLRDDYRKEKGETFSLRNFHDEILSYGSPPIVALRKLMLENQGTMDDIL
ncbi:MAG: DUF885 domain-containing protein [Candidatus Kariarchaeaceae archaeon]|jgi:uncharacterized protein (DUF885 family)